MEQTNNSNSNNNIRKTDLEKIICDVFNVKEVPPLIERQIYRFITEDKMTYKEIARCIVWYTEVEGNKFDKIYYGIAIVSSIREQANKYFEDLKKAQAEKEREAKEIATSAGNNIIFNISKVEHKHRKPKSFDVNMITVPNIKDVKKGDGDGKDN